MGNIVLSYNRCSYNIYVHHGCSLMQRHRDEHNLFAVNTVQGSVGGIQQVLCFKLEVSTKFAGRICNL